MSVLYVLLVFYFILCLITYSLQEKFIFFPAKLPQDYPFEEFPDAEEVFLSTEGESLHGLLFRVPNPKGTVLFFHGNAGAVNTWGWEAEDFTNRGYELLMPDYRSYGKSTGRLSEKALMQDAQLFYDYLKKQHDPSRIIIVGRSLGSGIACHLATKVPFKLLLLETPYLSMTAMAKLKMPIFPTNLLLRYKFRNDLNIKKVKGPVHIIHGTKDELIPYHHAEKLLELSGQNARLSTISNGGHNNFPEFTSYQKILDEILL